MNSIEQDFWLELAQIQAESIGWIPLDEGAYLHVGSDEPVIQVVGLVKEEMAGSNVLWLVWSGNVAKYKSFEQNSVYPKTGTPNLN